MGQIKFTEGSFSNLSNFTALFNTSDIIINCVGILNEEGNQTFKKLHTDIPEKLAILAKKNGVKKFIHISSIGANPESDSKYSKSKGIAEVKILEVFPEAVILRPSIVLVQKINFLIYFSNILCLYYQ